MEHVHTAGIAGTIAAIAVAEGEQVTTGRIVIEIEAGSTTVVPGRRSATRDPATTAVRFAKAGAAVQSNGNSLWLWVPSFAGTTMAFHLGRPGASRNAMRLEGFDALIQVNRHLPTRA